MATSLNLYNAPPASIALGGGSYTTNRYTEFYFGKVSEFFHWEVQSDTSNTTIYPFVIALDDTNIQTIAAGYLGHDDRFEPSLPKLDFGALEQAARHTTAEYPGMTNSFFRGNPGTYLTGHQPPFIWRDHYKGQTARGDFLGYRGQYNMAPPFYGTTTLERDASGPQYSYSMTTNSTGSYYDMRGKGIFADADAPIWEDQTNGYSVTFKSDSFAYLEFPYCVGMICALTGQLYASGVIFVCRNSDDYDRALSKFVENGAVVSTFENSFPQITGFEITIHQDASSKTFNVDNSIPWETGQSPHPETFPVGSGGVSTQGGSGAGDVGAVDGDPFVPKIPSITPGGPGGSSASPFQPGGSTTPTIPGQGGTPESPGTWELPSDKVDGDEISPMNTLGTGLYRAYAMSQSDVTQFGKALWSASVLETMSKYFDNPMDVIIGCVQLPVTADVGGRKEITFSWIPDWANELNVQGAPISHQYKTVDFGTIDVKRFSGTFYDYQPYSNAQLYLPYVGFVPIKLSEVIGGQISLKYTIDVCTGAAVAKVTSSKIGCIGIYNCSVGVQVPLNSRNFGELYMTIAKTAIAGLASIATGAIAPALGAAANANASKAVEYRSTGQDFFNRIQPVSGVDAAASVQAGYEVKALQSLATADRQNRAASVARGAGTAGQAATGILNVMENGLQNASNSTAPYQRNGSFDALSGRLAPQSAYLLLSIPHQNYPGTYYDKYIGFPSNIQGVLGNFSGYIECRTAAVTAEGATGPEIEEILAILRGGIINAIDEGIPTYSP